MEELWEALPQPQQHQKGPYNNPEVKISEIKGDKATKVVGITSIQAVNKDNGALGAFRRTRTKPERSYL